MNVTEPQSLTVAATIKRMNSRLAAAARHPAVLRVEAGQDLPPLRRKQPPGCRKAWRGTQAVIGTSLEASGMCRRRAATIASVEQVRSRRPLGIDTENPHITAGPSDGLSQDRWRRTATRSSASSSWSTSLWFFLVYQSLDFVTSFRQRLRAGRS